MLNSASFIVSHHGISLEPKESKGKGLGIYTDRAVAAGAEILLERPLFFVPVYVSACFRSYMACLIKGNPSARGQSRSNFVRWIRRPEIVDKRAAFETLSTSSRAKATTSDLGLWDRFQSNAVICPEEDVERGIEGEKQGIFLTFGRINTRCTPNCEALYDAAAEAIRVVAIVDIPAHEEIFISYIPTWLLVAERRGRLQCYGFHCECFRCVEEDGYGHDDLQFHNCIMLHNVHKLQENSYPVPLRFLPPAIDFAIHAHLYGLLPNLYLTRCYGDTNFSAERKAEVLSAARQVYTEHSVRYKHMMHRLSSL